MKKPFHIYIIAILISILSALLLSIALEAEGQTNTVYGLLNAQKKGTNFTCGSAFVYTASASFYLSNNIATNNPFWPGTNVHSTSFTNPSVKVVAQSIFGGNTCAIGSGAWTNNDLSQGYRFLLLWPTNTPPPTNQLIPLEISGFTNAP